MQAYTWKFCQRVDKTNEFLNDASILCLIDHPFSKKNWKLILESRIDP